MGRVLARELSWQGTARQYELHWKSVATIVKRAVQYGLKDRLRPPVHVIGIDEVSRRKGQVYLTVVYNLERRVLLWVGDDRTEEASGRSSPKKWGYPEQPGKGPGKRNKEPAGITAPAGRSRRQARES